MSLVQFQSPAPKPDWLTSAFTTTAVMRPKLPGLASSTEPLPPAGKKRNRVVIVPAVGLSPVRPTSAIALAVPAGATALSLTAPAAVGVTSINAKVAWSSSSVDGKSPTDIPPRRSTSGRAAPSEKPLFGALHSALAAEKRPNSSLNPIPPAAAIAPSYAAGANEAGVAAGERVQASRTTSVPYLSDSQWFQTPEPYMRGDCSWVSGTSVVVTHPFGGRTKPSHSSSPSWTWSSIQTAVDSYIQASPFTS